MLETGLSPLFVQTLKMQVDYILKVMKMDSYRLPKIAALQVIRTKTSWYGDWMEIARNVGMELNLDYSNIDTMKVSLYQLISMVDTKQREKYMNDATGSLYRQLYSQLNHNLKEKNYFTDGNSIAEISMMVKLRGELLQLNFVPHREDLPITCSLCNLEEREDVFHFMGKCPILKEIRRNAFGSNILTRNQIIDLLNNMEVKKLFSYCRLALAYRNNILNECF